MFLPKDFIRDDIKNLKPYMPAMVPCKIKLDANESPSDIPTELKQKIWERIRQEKFNYYYDPNCTELRESLSKYTGFDKENIFIGSGADEIISDIAYAFAGPGRDVIIPAPAFESYEVYSIISGANVIKVPLASKEQPIPWDLDVERIKQYFRHDRSQVLFLTYPNNPTGNYFSEDKIMELICNFNGIIAIDEAYYEFGGRTFADRISEYNNIIIIRTLSKLFSMASLRVGYALGNEDVIEQLYKVKLPYNVSMFSQIAAIEVLNEHEWIEEQRKKIIQSRSELKKHLDKIPGMYVYTSFTNFFLAEFEKSRDMIYEKLLNRGILTKKFYDFGLDTTLRFSIGLPEQNKILIEAFKEILECKN